MADAKFTGRLPTVRGLAVALTVMLIGLGGVSSASAQMGQPNPPVAPGAAPPGAPPTAAAPPAVVHGGRGANRSITRAEFIERRKQAATRRGRDPERAAAHAAALFDQADTNHDGVVDPAERAAFEASHPQLHRRKQQ